MTIEELFKLGSLVAAINHLPTVPTYLARLFQVKRQKNTAVIVDEQSGKLSLVPAGDRRGPGAPTGKTARKARTFSTIHLPTTGFVLAEDAQGVRGFGEEDQAKTIAELVNDELQRMKNNIIATREHLRVGAIQGKIYDADGTTLIENLFTAFGVTQETVACALNVNTTKVRTKIMEAKRKSEAAIGDTVMIRGWKCIASPGFMDAFTNHDDVKKAWEGWQAAQDRLGGDVRAGFTYGSTEFMEYNVSVGGVSYIADGEAFLFPDVPGMLVEAIAPANYEETVNTLGLEYYAKAEPMKFGKGRDLEAQSNPLPLNLIPKSSIKLTAT